MHLCKVSSSMAATTMSRLYSRNSGMTMATVAMPVMRKPSSLMKLAKYKLSHNSKRFLKVGGIGLASLGLAQYQLGTANNFFEHKFITSKNPEDLADFYGTEDLMEVFCVFPFMVNLMMRQASFDDAGVIHAWGLLGPGELEVHVDFDEERRQQHDCTTDASVAGNGEGSSSSDTITWFNKRERFRDTAPAWIGGFTIWEMTQNFGYHVRKDGTSEIYHHGEHFSGFFPVRLLFQLHAKYVIWAAERYINGDEFGSEEREDDAQEFRQNIPLHEFQLFLEGLTHKLEQAKKDVSAADGDGKKQKELNATLRRLKTISKMDHSKTQPRLRTLQSRKTRIKSVHLVVDDKETKDAIRAAMEHISEVHPKDCKQQQQQQGGRQEPIAVMRTLTRRTTLANAGGRTQQEHPRQHQQ